MKKYKRNFLLALISSILLTVAACGNEQDEQTEIEENGATSGDIDVEQVAIVNGDAIETTEFLIQMDQVKQMYAQQGLNLEEEGNEELLEMTEERLLDQLITRKLVIQEAERHNVGPSEEELEMELENFKAQFPEEEDYTQALDMQNYTEEQLRDEIREELTYLQLLELNHLDDDELTISEDELRERYEELSQEYELDDFEEVQDELEKDVKQNKYLKNLRESAEIEIFI